MGKLSAEVEPDLGAFASFEALRLQMRRFVSERAWEPFHTPNNVLLALSGESGELCEIFQWMGHVKVLRPADEKKIVHIGEEISDVVLYTTRLADLCGINLARAATIALDHPQCDPAALAEMASALSCVEFQTWDDISIDGYQRVTKSYMGHCRSVVDNSPRTLLYYIQACVGKVCSRFWRYTEDESTGGLGRWRPEDKAAVALSLGRLMLSACMLCNEVGISLSEVVADKYAKNVKKYPKELAKGSSDKYTVYMNAKSSNIDNTPARSTMILFAATIATAAVFVTRAYWKRM